MSGFSGMIVFNEKLSSRLECYEFPLLLNDRYSKIGEISQNFLRLAHYSNRKFVNDSFLSNEVEHIFGLSGVILNTIDKFPRINSPEGFVHSCIKTKGSFSSLYFDKKSVELILICDQTGSRQLFYFWNSDFAAFSSSIFLLISILKHFNIRVSVSTPASYMMLSLGYLLEDYTLISEIKKIKAGTLIKISKHGTKNEKYHDYFREIKHYKITKELLAELNDRYFKAIELEYEKDKSYNYKHLATLSGGLDSRMNVMLAYKNGYRDITCLTFFQRKSQDEKIARQISYDLGLNHLVFSMDSGGLLSDIDIPLMLNNCAVYYFGGIQTFAAVSNTRMEAFGLLHNGGLAESSKGGYLSKNYHEIPSLDKQYAVSDKFFDKIDKQILKDILNQYPNKEMFITYNRGFNAIHNGLWMALPYTDSVSTFMDIDFAEIAYSIDPKLRYGGFLTIEWINFLHPELSRYKWKYGIRPTNNSIQRLIGKVSNRMGLMITGSNRIMSAIEIISQKDNNFKQMINQYRLLSSRDMVPEEIQEDVEKLLNEGIPEERLLCISYLRSLELLLNA